MELTQDISAEQLPQSHHGSMASLIQAEQAAINQDNKHSMDHLSDDELTQKVETILLERIKEGNKVALFQLGQLYYEQVGVFDSNPPNVCSAST